MDADSHGDEAQAGLSQLVGGKRILAGGEDLLKVAVGSASRRVGVPARNVSSSGGLTLSQFAPVWTSSRSSRLI